MYDVFVYGEIGADNVLRVPFFPTPGKDARIISDSYEPGGAASNVAIFLAQWGLRVGLSGNVLGDDFFGSQMLSFLEQYPKLDLSYVQVIPGVASPYCRIMVHPDGERLILFNNDDAPIIPFNLSMLTGARIMSIDLNGGPERVEAARLADTAGVITALGDVISLDHPILPYCRVITNSTALIRHALPGVDLVTHAQTLQQAYDAVVITTDGPNPVHVVGPRGLEFWVYPPQVEVVDTTGAGDALKAGVLYGIWKGWEWPQIVAWGVASGSLNACRLGASSCPPTLNEIEQLLPNIKVIYLPS